MLDRLLEVGGLELDTLSGSSAGAVNAVALAAGWLEGGAEGARERLTQLWEAVSELLPVPLASGAVRAFAIGLATHLFSPTDLNPLGIDPLRDILERLVDFDRLRGQHGLRLLVAATSVRTGAARIFETHEMTPEVVLASAALPQLHEAVLIDGEAYWDGGLSSNPPLVALARRSRTRRVLLVRLTPWETDAVPRAAPDIRARLSEIGFSRPLHEEIAQLASARRLRRAGPGWLSSEIRHLARMRLAVIDGDATLAALPPLTRIEPGRELVLRLRDAGRDAADVWLARRASAVGQGQLGAEEEKGGGDGAA